MMIMTMMTTASMTRGITCLYLLVTAAVVANDVGQSRSQHSIQLLSTSTLSAAAAAGEDVAHNVCSIDSRTTAIQCVNTSLVEIPANLPANTKMLDLSHNHITQVTAQYTRHLSAVEIMRLQNNKVSTISSDAFVNCTSLHSLYLDHNLLSSVRFVNRTHVQELHISFNRITELETSDTVLPVRTLDLSFNSLRQFNCSLLSSLQNIRMLNLSHNLIETVLLDDSLVLSLSSVSHFDVASNRLTMFTLCDDCYLYSLQYLDLSSNRLHSVDSSWCRLLPNLTVLIVSRNPVSSVASGTFTHCLSLCTLHLSSLLIHKIDAGMFKGLTHLRSLRLDHNNHLVSLQWHLFRDLPELVELDLNSCSLTALEPETFVSSSSLLVIQLGENPWHCDCEATVVQELSRLSGRGVHVSEDTVCVEPPSVRGEYVLNVSSERDECRAARPQMPRQTVWAYMGKDLLVNCNATGDQPLNTTWFWKHHGNIVPVRHVNSLVDFENIKHSVDMLVLHTGSLYIGSVTRSSAGLYYCIVSNEFGNGTMVVSVRLNSEAISVTTLYSIIIGLLSAAGFFLVAVVIGIVRYLAYICSRKERRKRKSIRAVLESIQDYKCAQFDRFSAYRTAKMDQLSAYKSAKIEQLSAFRDARVDKLRTYKQATVASILTHIERMREHYTAQTARIKDNCAQQADRLRERYSARRGRFRNYRSHQVDKMRESYAAQAARIREYGMIQMSRLREQYKTQQQHVLKLVELLDVGSCMSGVIEAECMKAESMIFDADIAFDFEAQPAHANESLIGASADAVSESSHYVTASDSDLSVSSEEYSVTCVADVSVQVSVPDPDDMAGVLAVANDVLRHMELEEQGGQCENHEVSSLVDVQMLEDAREQELRVKRSSSGKSRKNSVGCMELTDVTGDADCSQQVHNAVQQDTSC